MAETVSGPLTSASTRWLTAALGLLVTLAFVATAALFAVLLRPWAGDRPPLETAGDRPAIATEVAPPVEAAPQPAAPSVEAAPPTELPSQPAIPPQLAAFDGPRIAIVLTGLGTNPLQTQAAIADLPPEVGLAFSPYPDATRALAAAARLAGHEVWAGIPMQPKSWPRVSPGANTLTVGATEAENRQRLAWSLARIGPVTGVTSIMGSAFTESAASLDPVLADLRDRKLVVLDSRSSGKSVAVARARVLGVPALLNDRFLDESGDLAGRLAGLEQVAKANGSAVGFASPTPASVAAIATWAKTLESKGIRLVAPGDLAK